MKVPDVVPGHKWAVWTVDGKQLKKGFDTYTQAKHWGMVNVKEDSFDIVLYNDMPSIGIIKFKDYDYYAEKYGQEYAQQREENWQRLFDDD